MPDAVDFAPGGYRYVPGGQFSLGVAALPGFALRRLRSARPLPLAEGFAAARAAIAAAGRPAEALALCELRMPVPLDRADFIAFNERYLAAMRGAGLPGNAPYPVGRSNLAPVIAPPAEAVLFAVTVTVPAKDAGGRDFFVSGKPEIEALGGKVVGGADVSPAGMLEKARFVMAELRARAAELGADWSAITAMQAYAVHELLPVLDTVLAGAPQSWGGLTWVPAHPPVTGLAFEVDIRSVSEEGLL
jgi:hypothetical protein